MISTFLPWISISAGALAYNFKQGQNGFHGIGILYFILLIIIIAAIDAGALAVICMIISYGNVMD